MGNEAPGNEGFLLEGRTLLQNARNDAEILEAVKVYGYDEKRLDTGIGLLIETEDLILKQKKEYGEQYQATEDLGKAWDAADKAYMKTLKIARLVFQDNPKASASLKLWGDRKQSVQGWLEQAGKYLVQERFSLRRSSPSRGRTAWGSCRPNRRREMRGSVAKRMDTGRPGLDDAKAGPQPQPTDYNPSDETGRSLARRWSSGVNPRRIRWPCLRGWRPAFWA